MNAYQAQPSSVKVIVSTFFDNSYAYASNIMQVRQISISDHHLLGLICLYCFKACSHVFGRYLLIFIRKMLQIQNHQFFEDGPHRLIINLRGGSASKVYPLILSLCFRLTLRYLYSMGLPLINLRYHAISGYLDPREFTSFQSLQDYFKTLEMLV